MPQLSRTNTPPTAVRTLYTMLPARQADAISCTFSATPASPRP
ncbi:hypothetical protein [Streptomyces chrestomyceticus]